MTALTTNERAELFGALVGKLQFVGDHPALVSSITDERLRKIIVEAAEIANVLAHDTDERLGQLTG